MKILFKIFPAALICFSSLSPDLHAADSVVMEAAVNDRSLQVAELQRADIAKIEKPADFVQAGAAFDARSLQVATLQRADIAKLEKPAEILEAEKAREIEEALNKELQDLNEERTSLFKEITELDKELSKCKNQKTGWAIATALGSAGVIATGVTAIVQGKTLKDKKSELADSKEAKKSAQEELNTKNQQAAAAQKKQ
jgi:deoxycytidylate deaminase